MGGCSLPVPSPFFHACHTYLVTLNLTFFFPVTLCLAPSSATWPSFTLSPQHTCTAVCPGPGIHFPCPHPIWRSGILGWDSGGEVDRPGDPCPVSLPIPHPALPGLPWKEEEAWQPGGISLPYLGFHAFLNLTCACAP